MKKSYRRDEWSGIALICGLSILCWLAVFGAIELLREIIL